MLCKMLSRYLKKIMNTKMLPEYQGDRCQNVNEILKWWMDSNGPRSHVNRVNGHSNNSRQTKCYQNVNWILQWWLNVKMPDIKVITKYENKCYIKILTGYQNVTQYWKLRWL